jgi:hypothetical protein
VRSSCSSARSHAVIQRWSRDRNPHDGGSYKLPSEDLNAPDLYIPLMAFVTYILVMGFIMGITDTFTPEVLVRARLTSAVLANLSSQGSTASWAMAVLLFEVSPAARHSEVEFR